MKRFLFLTGIIGLFFVQQGNSQQKNNFDQHLAFSPNLLTFPESPYRSAAGMPGSGYWQNKADYNIAATLDTTAQIITATATITYINNSPDKLDYLWLELGQNLFREGSRGNYTQGAPTDAGGFRFNSVKVQTGIMFRDAHYIISDTRMQVRLDPPLAPRGGIIKLKFDYSFRISDKQFRTGRVLSKNGTLYDVAQWYPRMCVYDDLRGWNTLPYLGAGEFYCEYGDFDYQVTVPWDMIVTGSGKLVNPEEVLTKKQINKLNEASKSDKTRFIISPEEVASPSTRPVQKGWLTWHFKMSNSRDVAWATSKAYIWDAARINLPGGKKSLAMSVYPEESRGDTAWSRSTEYLKHSVEHFSEKWFPYPYPVAVNIAGSAGGMEYPGLCFCGWKIDNAKVMYYVTAHEIGHNWFPMIVGSDERRFAFMDEGLNTFIDIYAQNDFNNCEFGPKRDGEYDKDGNNPARDIVPYMTGPDAESIVNYADVMNGKYSHTLNYYKTALGLVMAREYILGEERFDYAFREYIAQWAYKHPAPNDFFRMMNNSAGEDLNWFWNEWFCQTWTLDQGIKNVTYKDQDPSKGALITLINNEQMVMPVVLKIEEENGDVREIRLPVEIWQKGGEYIFNYPSTSRIKAVTIDPKKELPDTNPANNYWGDR